jgi:hypothetical protein
LICQAETEQALLEEAQGQDVVWAEVAGEAEWAAISRGQALVESVFVQVVARECPISKEFLAIQ